MTIADKIRFTSTLELAASQKPPEVQEIGLNWKRLFIYPLQHIVTIGMLAISA